MRDRGYETSKAFVAAIRGMTLLRSSYKIQWETLNPKPLNPKPLNPKPYINPKGVVRDWRLIRVQGFGFQFQDHPSEVLMPVPQKEQVV